MAKRHAAPGPVGSGASVPIHRQLYEGVRVAILSGRLAAGSRLPSTRELGVSRNTVTYAFLQLLAEGYLEGRVGSGTYVAKFPPDDLLRTCGGEPDGTNPPARPAGRRLSRRGELLAAAPTATLGDGGRPRAFRPGVPALEEFPRGEWKRLAAGRWCRLLSGLLGYGNPAGYRPLHEAIADYLGAARAVR